METQFYPMFGRAAETRSPLAYFRTPAFNRLATTSHHRLAPRAAAGLRHSVPPGVHLPTPCLTYAYPVLARCGRCLLSNFLSNCSSGFSLKVCPILYFLSGRPIFHRLANSATSSPLHSGEGLGVRLQWRGVGGEVSLRAINGDMAWELPAGTQIVYRSRPVSRSHAAERCAPSAGDVRACQPSNRRAFSALNDDGPMACSIISGKSHRTVSRGDTAITRPAAIRPASGGTGSQSPCPASAEYAPM